MQPVGFVWVHKNGVKNSDIFKLHLRCVAIGRNFFENENRSPAKWIFNVRNVVFIYILPTTQKGIDINVF